VCPRALTAANQSFNSSGEPQDAKGLALNKDYFKSHDKKYNPSKARQYLRDPCDNCKELIRLFDATLKNFHPHVEWPEQEDE
jgi:hypothetical protein